MTRNAGKIEHTQSLYVNGHVLEFYGTVYKPALANELPRF